MTDPKSKMIVVRMATPKFEALVNKMRRHKEARLKDGTEGTEMEKGWRPEVEMKI